MWKFTLDLTHPVEDGILDSANFVGFLVKAFEFGEWEVLLAFLILVSFYGMSKTFIFINIFWLNVPNFQNASYGHAANCLWTRVLFPSSQ